MICAVFMLSATLDWSPSRLAAVRYAAVRHPSVTLLAGERPHFDWRELRAMLIDGEHSSRNRGEVPPGPDDNHNWGFPPPPAPSAPPSRSRWWVHELAVPERGCVLLAQPHAIFPEQPLLRRAVVLVLEHSETEGTVGLLMQRPANRTIADLLARRDDLLLRPFRTRPLYIGGDVLPARRGLRVLTRRCDVPAANQVLFGMWECTPAAAARMVSIGAADASEFDFYAAACQWSPDKLREELDAAVWLPAAASAPALCERTGASALDASALDANATGAQALNPEDLYFSLIEGVGGK